MSVCPRNLLLVCALFLSCGSSSVQADPYLEAIRAAQYELEAAKLAYRMYRNVEYPQESRALQASIDLMEEDLKFRRHREEVYRSFNKFQNGNPLPVSAHYNRMGRLQEEQQVKELRRTQSGRMRYRSDKLRLMEMRIYAAHARLQELLGRGQ